MSGRTGRNVGSYTGMLLLDWPPCISGGSYQDIAVRSRLDSGNCGELPSGTAKPLFRQFAGTVDWPGTAPLHRVADSDIVVLHCIEIS